MNPHSRYELADLVIEVLSTPKEAKMVWRGASDTRRPSTLLEPVFKDVVRQLGSRRLIIDFRELDFMNSSTVSPIITLLKTLNQDGIETHVIFGNEEWQQVHMRCIRTICRVFKHVAVGDTTPN